VSGWLRQAAGGFGLVAFADTAWLFGVTVVIWTLGEMLQSPSNSALVADLSPTALRGRYQGVNFLSWSAGAALAPILGGFVQEHLGDAVLWLGCFGVAAAVALGQLLSGPTRDRRIARLRAVEAVAATEPHAMAADRAADRAAADQAADALAAQPPDAAGPVAQVPPGELSGARD
jgi:MFS family permease